VSILARILRNLQSLVERFPKLAMLSRYWRDTRFLFDDPKKTPLGFKFIGDTRMDMGILKKRKGQLS
jgi:hypothetical protein